ncbi:hypothetical protein JCM10908_004524 [Rhodotorula pacifica]|uniref:uncharacterized protein n=1 Tax=Rhodotorula pacifica TaxID=1495444 RepID=UPI00316C18D5
MATHSGPSAPSPSQSASPTLAWSASLCPSSSSPPHSPSQSHNHADADAEEEQPIDSRFHLPPHQLATDSALYEGDAPNILADNVLLHPPNPKRPAIGSRSSSWHSALWATDADAHEREGERRSDDKKKRRRTTTPPAAADRYRDDVNAAQEPGEGEEDDQDHRDEYARSKSRHRKLPWYKRPSPIWFFPGTLVIALTMGMTIAPKLEIYTQLICRSLPVNESGVTVPPPVYELGRGVMVGSPLWDKHPLSSGSGMENGTSLALEWHASPSSANETLPTTTTTTSAASPISSGTWAQQCHRSRAVQSQVARLALLLSLLMGILSSLTTGWWGAFSDRRGRKPVLVLALAGSLAMDVVFLLTVYYHSTLTYNFLLLGPILDGLVGGYSTAQATSAAYISDTTSPGSRAKIFSAIGGLMYGGFAMGPVLGSFLITHSRLGVLAPFYAALAMHAAYLLFLALLLPESLSSERKHAARERHDAERAERKRKEREEHQTGWQRLGRLAARPLAFLKPVALLLPQKLPTKDSTPTTPTNPEERTNIEWGAHLSEYWNPEEVWKSPDPNKTLGRAGGGSTKADWTLTKIAAAWACYMGIMAVMSVKLMYANFVFGWGAAEDGYYLSFLGVLRVVMLVGLIPLIIKLVRRKPAPLPLRPRPADSSPKAATAWDHEKRWLRVVHDSHFDLSLARWSLFLDLCGFVLFLLAPYLLPSSLRGSSQHIALFLTAAVLQSMGSGASPAIQSLALAHASPRDAGRLFASLSVVQSIASQVIGPILFSVLFMQTVGRWSEAVFALASLLAAMAVLSLSLVRLRTVVLPSAEDYEARTATSTSFEATESDFDPATPASLKLQSTPTPTTGRRDGDDASRGRQRSRVGSNAAEH